MLRLRSVLLFLLCPAWLGAAGPSPVKASLVAEVSSFTPGKPFLAGVRLQHDAGWHTYWKDPGDSGLPTTVAWNLPKGVTAGPLEWPEPQFVLDAAGLKSN